MGGEFTPGPPSRDLGTGSGRRPGPGHLPPGHRCRAIAPHPTGTHSVTRAGNGPSDRRRKAPRMETPPPIRRYRAIATPPGTRAYPVGRAVNVPRPWVRLRNLVA